MTRANTPRERGAINTKFGFGPSVMINGGGGGGRGGLRREAKNKRKHSSRAKALFVFFFFTKPTRTVYTIKMIIIIERT